MAWRWFTGFPAGYLVVGLWFPARPRKSAGGFQRLGSQLALVRLVQVVELAPGVDHAPDFGDAGAEPGLVVSGIIADQLTRSVAHEAAGVLVFPARLGVKS